MSHLEIKRISLSEIYDFIKTHLKSNHIVKSSAVKNKMLQVYGSRAPKHFGKWASHFRRKVVSAGNLPISLAGDVGCQDFSWCIVGCGVVVAVYDAGIALGEEDDEN